MEGIFDVKLPANILVKHKDIALHTYLYFVSDNWLRRICSGDQYSSDRAPLEHPWGLTSLDNQRVLVTTRPGSLYLINISTQISKK